MLGETTMKNSILCQNYEECNNKYRDSRKSIYSLGLGDN